MAQAKHCALFGALSGDSAEAHILEDYTTTHPGSSIFFAKVFSGGSLLHKKASRRREALRIGAACFGFLQSVGRIEWQVSALSAF
jgi:hypothetical protein